jgi:hypothetical protein
VSLEQTLLALGVPAEDAPRYAAVAPGPPPAEPVDAPVAMAEAAPAAPPSAAILPAPEPEPAPARLARADIIPSAPLAPVSAPPSPLGDTDDPIASLIIAAGGLR